MQLNWGGWKMQLFEEHSNKTQLLAGIPLLEGLSSRALMEISRHTDEVTVPRGEKLTKEGQQAHQAFVVVRGSVSVTRGGRVMETLHPGDTLGVMAAIDGEPHSSTCIADEECTLLVLSIRDLTTLFGTVPELHRRVILTLSRRFREAERKLDSCREQHATT